MQTDGLTDHVSPTGIIGDGSIEKENITTLIPSVTQIDGPISNLNTMIIVLAVIAGVVILLVITVALMMVMMVSRSCCGSHKIRRTNAHPHHSYYVTPNPMPPRALNNQLSAPSVANYIPIIPIPVNPRVHMRQTSSRADQNDQYDNL